MATTRLALWGASGPLPFHTGFTRNTLMVGRTQLRVPGLPGTLNSIPSKTIASLVTIVTSDTYNLSWIEDPFDTNQIITQDAYRISISESSQLFNAVSTTDTWAISISETIGLVQQGVVSITTTDSWALAWSESTTTSVSVTTTDIWNLALSESSSLSTPAVVIATTDAWNLSWSEQSVIGIFTGVLQIPVVDTYALSWTETTDVTRISPTKPFRIRIQPLTARIRITPI
jgi:hypothetical protein